ncbi:hypothetical protein QQ045_018146 [Rhodiola kirilowii]
MSVPMGLQELVVLAIIGLSVINAPFSVSDTVAPTAYVLTSAPFTNALNVTLDISFSEPYAGFTCSSAKDCNLNMCPNESLSVRSWQSHASHAQHSPAEWYSLLVALSNAVQVERVIAVMDK